MNRRHFLRTSTIAAVTVGGTHLNAFADGEEKPTTDWKKYRLRYEVEIPKTSDNGTLWLPIPQDMGDYQRFLSINWEGNTSGATLYREQIYSANIFSLSWAEQTPKLNVTFDVALRDRGRNFPAVKQHDLNQQDLYLRPTQHMPIDGIVAETAHSIVDSFMTPDDKARAIYNWVLDNTFREPTTRGCGMVILNSCWKRVI